MNQVFIPTNKGTRVVMSENIIRIEANSNYCTVFFNDCEPLTVAKVLQWFEGRLPHEYFLRIHRGHIVNRMYISSISNNSKLTLINGVELQTSRRKKSIVRNMAMTFGKAS